MPAVSGSPTQLAASVTTLANLGGLPDDAYKDGDFAYVQSTRATYQLDRTSAATPSSVAVDAFSGNGQWVFFQASSSWESQATWYIDPAAGDDENDGETTTTALETWAEFTRRVKIVNIAMTVTILSNIAEALRATFETTATPAAWLWIKGQSTVLASGSASTFVNPVAATNTRGSATVTDLTTSGGVPTSFTGYVGYMLRAPLDADGPTYLPVLKAGAGGEALAGFWGQNLGTTKPANGALVEVLALITAPTVEIVTNGLPVRCTEIEFASTTSTESPCLNTLRQPQHGSGNILLSSFVGCKFNSGPFSAQSWFIGCLFTASASSSTIWMNGTAAIFNGGGSLRNLSVVGPGRVSFQGFMFQGGKLTVGAVSSTTIVLGNCVGAEATTASSPLGVFDATGPGIEVYNNAVLGLNTVYGSGNSTYGMVVGSGGIVKISGTPYITGTSGDVQVEGAATAIPPLTATAVVPAASALTTWAQWIAAPFSRMVFNYSTGSRIIG